MRILHYDCDKISQRSRHDDICGPFRYCVQSRGHMSAVPYWRNRSVHDSHVSRVVYPQISIHHTAKLPGHHGRTTKRARSYLSYCKKPVSLIFISVGSKLKDRKETYSDSLCTTSTERQSHCSVGVVSRREAQSHKCLSVPIAKTSERISRLPFL